MRAWLGLCCLVVPRRRPTPISPEEGLVPKHPLFILSLLIGLAACDRQPVAPVGIGIGAEDKPLAASKPVGPVTINTVIDFTEFPFEGTFTVTAGV